MKRAPSYDFVTREATSDEGMAAKHRILFHCFNDNGVYAELRAMQRRIDDWVDANPSRPNGILFVHGSLNDHPRDLLFKALDAPKKRKAVCWTIDYAIRNARDRIAKGDAWLADPSQWPAPKKRSAS